MPRKPRQPEFCFLQHGDHFALFGNDLEPESRFGFAARAVFGLSPALAQVMGGQIPVMFDGFATSRALIASNKVQAYAVASKSRLSLLPDVPTFTELGYPELNFSNWLGVVVSGAMSAEQSEKIHKAVKAVAMNPKFKERMLANGFEAAEDANIQQMTQTVKADFDRNAAIVKQFNIQINQ